MVIRTITLFVTAIVAGSLMAGDWIFDPETRYVSDGVWTFNATVDDTKGTITFGRVIDDSSVGVPVPTELAEVDFAKPVRAEDGSHSYVIVQLGSLFNGDRGGGVFGYLGAHQNDPQKTAVADLVGKITLPGEGLTRIGDCAFYGCKNMSGTIRFPDSLTGIGKRAFENAVGGNLVWENVLPENCTTICMCAFLNSSLSGDIKVYATSIPWSVFSQTKVTSAQFGPGTVKHVGAYNAGMFFHCTELTNVTFDAEMSGGVLAAGAAFDGCTKLEFLDLRGFSELGRRVGGYGSDYPILAGSGVTKVLVSSNLTYVNTTCFNGANKLQEVHFYGFVSESVWITPLFGGSPGGQIIKSIVHKDVLSDGDVAAWQQCAEGGVIAESGTYWRQDLAGGNYLSRPLVWYKPEVIGELGDWVYDDSGEYPVVSNGIWRFKAELQGGEFVAVKAVDGWPTELSALDFTGTVSDRIGHPCSFSSLDCGFATTFGGSPYYKPTAAHAAAQNVGELRIPETGVTAIGRGSFAFCVNLTNVVNYLPDSVNSIGIGAFFKVPAKQDLSLKGLVNSTYNIFGQSGVTSVTFGPNLKSFTDAWSNAAFDDCKSLTNVTFDSRCQVTSLGGSTYGAFHGCSSLGGTIDISCFRVLTMTGFFAGCPITEFVIGTNVTAINSSFFDAGGYGKCNALTNLVFLGAAPAAMSGLKDFLKYRGTDNVVKTTVSRKFRSSWIPFTNEGKVARSGSHWASDYIGGEEYVESRPIQTVESDGLRLIVK